MHTNNNSYLISIVRGKSNLLRIPKELAGDLNFQGSKNVITILPNNRKLSVRVNVDDRTIMGLGPWLKSKNDENIRSIRLKIIDRNPYTFGVEFSKEAPNVVKRSKDFKIRRPEKGLFIGRKLEPGFYELITTNEFVSINEDDLLQHTFICGSTGYGKTVLAKSIIEEAARKSIPVIAIDLKGDISSMAIQVSGEDPAELIPWIVPRKDQSKESEASSLSQKQKAKLDSWGLNFEDVQEYTNKVRVNVFTPRSDDCFRLALSAFVYRPQDLEGLKDKDTDFENAIHIMAETFVSRLMLSNKQASKAIGYVVEIIKYFWSQGTNLRGYDGVQRILDEVAHGEIGIEQIGGKTTNEYISTQDRRNISDAINTLLIGAQKLWFKGYPLEIEELINSDNYDGKTPVSIINLKHLGFQDQAYVVGYIAHLIWFWMKNLEGVDKPRLIFYIDEIAGGGGKQAFFPSTAISPSKPALSLLLKQGRGYGVCCMFATQSPGDIDYKALGQCSTWVVGRLIRKRERSKIEEAVSITDINFEPISDHIQTLGIGQFAITTPSIPWTIIQERWLMHPIHRSLSPNDLERLKEKYEKDVQSLIKKADKNVIEGKFAEAKEILNSIINGYKLSSLYANAYLLLGKVLYNMSDYKKSIETLNDLVKNRMESEVIGEAYFFLGKCKEQLQDFYEAAREFSKVVDSGASEETKESAEKHHRYCNDFATWPELTVIGKLFHWLSGKKADKEGLIRLQIEDRDILSELFSQCLFKNHFIIPEPIVDYEKLKKKNILFEQEEIEKNERQKSAETWVNQQIPEIQALLKNEAYENAHSLFMKCIIRLKQHDAISPEEFLIILKKYNKKGYIEHERLKNRLIKLQAKQFEHEIAYLFKNKGYKSICTKDTGDDGVDVFAWNLNEKLIIQCKRWKGTIGRSTVDEFAGVFNRYKDANKAILATTSTFSNDAKRVANKNHIELWDLYRLRQEWKAIYN